MVLIQIFPQQFRLKIFLKFQTLLIQDSLQLKENIHMLFTTLKINLYF